MPRLIDADALDSVVLRMNTKENAQITRGEYKLIDSVIFEFPTIDAVPVKHGKWVWDKNGRICSVCGNPVAFMLKDDGWYEGAYCPLCGARMDEE